MASSRVTTLFLTFALVLGSGTALADALPPGAMECEGSAAGAACTVRSLPGKCEAQTCKSAGVPDGDGGFTPGTERPCLVCVATGSSSSSSGGASSSSGGSDAGVVLSTPGEGGGGCNTGSSRTRTLDFALVGALGIIVAFAVRRRR